VVSVQTVVKNYSLSDRYATTLKRAGKSRDEIGEMMGHSTPEVTEHYLASLDMDKVWEINEGLF